MIGNLVRDLVLAGRATWRELTTCEGMPPAHRDRWQEARTVRELGQLGALYLEGQVGSQPAYQPNCGIDPETRPLVPTLARANRAGFFTNKSQPGRDDGYPDDKAWVLGFADEHAAWALIDLLGGSGLSYRFQRASERRPVIVHGKVGSRLFTERDIRNYFDDCHPVAVEALVNAVQVVIEDPDPGRDDRVWPLLEEYAEWAEAEGSRAG